MRENVEPRCQSEAKRKQDLEWKPVTENRDSTKERKHQENVLANDQTIHPGIIQRSDADRQVWKTMTGEKTTENATAKHNQSPTETVSRQPMNNAFRSES